MACSGANVLPFSIGRRAAGFDQRSQPGDVIESVDFDEEANSVVVHVRPRRATERRCGLCGRSAPVWSRTQELAGPRSRRPLLLPPAGDTPRVSCSDHGPTVTQVPRPPTERVTHGTSTTRCRGW